MSSVMLDKLRYEIARELVSHQQETQQHHEGVGGVGVAHKAARFAPVEPFAGQLV